MGLIQRGDLIARVAKAFGVKEKSAAPTLVGSVQPVAIVADARDEPVGAIERPFFGFEILTAAAGQFPTFQCLNPTGSGIDVVVDYIIIHSSAAQLVQWRLHGDVLANPTTKATQYRDTTPGQPLAQIRFASTATVYTGGGEARIVTSSIIVPIDTRFLPGVGLIVQGEVAAALLSCVFYGREIVKPFRTT